MNILPKKSWHVLSKDNIQRVRRDEAEAKAAEEEKEHRAAHAERESQLDFMRKRAREREDCHQVSVDSTSSNQTDGHVNFFSDIQQGVGVQLANKDHEQEVKSERESFEKRIGLLNYLVDKSKSDDPWYIAEKKAKDSAKSDRRKDSMDPMNDMKHHLATKRKCAEPLPQSTKKPVPKTVAVDASPTQHSSPAKTHSHKKHKHKSGKDKDKEAKLETLRRERLRREESEKIRSEALLKQHYGLVEDSEPSNSGDMEPSRPRKYNSQFNPSLARY